MRRFATLPTFVAFAPSHAPTNLLAVNCPLSIVNYLSAPGNFTPTVYFPGPAIKIGSNSPINAKGYSNPPFSRKNPFLK